MWPCGNLQWPGKLSRYGFCSSAFVIFARIKMSLRSFLLLLMLAGAVRGMAQGEWGTIKGGITFATDDGHLRGDMGAEIILFYIDSVMQPGSDAFSRHRAEDSIVNSAITATGYYELWEHSPIGKTQKQMVKKLKKMDAWPVERVRELDTKAAAIIADRERKQYAKAVAEGTGHYTIKLKPGYYGIIARSRHLRTHWRVEYRGKIILDKAYIKAGQVMTINEEIL